SASSTRVLSAAAPAAARRSRRGVERHGASLDEDARDLRLVIEEAAVGDDQIGNLALFNRAQPIRHPGNRRRADGHRTNGGVFVESCLDGLRGVLDEVLGIGQPMRFESERHTGTGELAGYLWRVRAILEDFD